MSTMYRSFSWLKLGLAMAAGVMATVAVVDPASAQSTTTSTTTSTMKNTRHNLSSGGSNTDTYGYTGGTGYGATEVCVFCHTPHGAQPTRGPLWNRASGNTTFTMYTSTSMSVDLSSSQPGFVSKACLSCHDGSQALNSVINAPGSGASSFGGTWQGGSTMTGMAAVGLGGTAGTTALNDDHPIGMEYAGAMGAAARVTGYQDAALISGSTNRWFVRDPNRTTTTAATQADKEDMILYAKNVECASCHDPHNGANGMFLRVPNEESRVCLTCHVK